MSISFCQELLGLKTKLTRNEHDDLTIRRPENQWRLFFATVLSAGGCDMLLIFGMYLQPTAQTRGG